MLTYEVVSKLKFFELKIVMSKLFSEREPHLVHSTRRVRLLPLFTLRQLHHLSETKKSNVLTFS